MLDTKWFIFHSKNNNSWTWMNLNMNNIILAIILCWLGRRLLNGVGFIDIVDLIVWIWRFLGNPSTAWNYKRNKEQKKSHCKQYFGIIRSQHQLQFRTPPNEDNHNLLSHTGPISLLDETHCYPIFFRLSLLVSIVWLPLFRSNWGK